MGVNEGKLEDLGFFRNDKGLGKVAEEGGVFAENGLAVEDLAIATAEPVGVGFEVTVKDANQGSGGEGRGEIGGWQLEVRVGAVPNGIEDG